MSVCLSVYLLRLLVVIPDQRVKVRGFCFFGYFMTSHGGQKFLIYFLKFYCRILGHLTGNVKIKCPYQYIHTCCLDYPPSLQRLTELPEFLLY